MATRMDAKANRIIKTAHAPCCTPCRLIAWGLKEKIDVHGPRYIYLLHTNCLSDPLTKSFQLKYLEQFNSSKSVKFEEAESKFNWPYLSYAFVSNRSYGRRFAIKIQQNKKHKSRRRACLPTI